MSNPRTYIEIEERQSNGERYKLEVWQTAESSQYCAAFWQVIRYDPVWFGWWIEAQGGMTETENAKQLARRALNDVTSGLAKAVQS